MKGNKGWVVVVSIAGKEWPFWSSTRDLRREAIAQVVYATGHSWERLRLSGYRVVKVRLVEGWE